MRAESDWLVCESKLSETAAILYLFKHLSLNGFAVTVYAMGCQKESASQIRTQK